MASMVENGAELAARGMARVGQAAERPAAAFRIGQGLAPLSHVSLHPVGEAALLFDQARQRIYPLSGSAVFVWCCLEEGIAPAEIAELLEKQLLLDRSAGDAYVAGLLQQWREIDLLAGEAVPALRALPRSRAREGEAAETALLPTPAAECSYRVLDSCYRLRFATAALHERAHPPLAHLALSALPAERTDLDLAAAGRGFALAEEGRVLQRCATLEQVAPMVRCCLGALALRTAGAFGLLQAAVRRGERCLLLAGDGLAARNGLAAGLAATGFQPLGSETLLLTADTLAVRPLPFGLGLETGSWGAAAPRFPTVADMPVRHRLEGRVLCYLVAGEAAPPLDSTLRVPASWIVFPVFRPDGGTGLVPLDRTETLRRLVPALHPLAGPLDAAAIERLVAWIDRLGCFELRLAALPEGVSLLADLCR